MAGLHSVSPESWPSTLMLDSDNSNDVVGYLIYERVGKATKMDAPGGGGCRGPEGGKLCEKRDRAFYVPDKVLAEPRSLIPVELDGTQELFMGRSDELDTH